MIHFITFKSLNNRKFTTILCILSIAFSVTLFLAIERIRTAAREGFTNTISQTDLIVGAKGGELNLLLYTVFHMGTPVNNIRFSSYEEIKNDKRVEWTIPISLGDSYKGHRVVATDENFFEHYRYRGDKPVVLSEGKIPTEVFDVVLGTEVAQKFKLKPGDPIVLTHGITDNEALLHERTPFKIVGILAPTQTPIDSGVYISLYGMEAMHFGWETGADDGEAVDPMRYKRDNIQIRQLTSFMVRTKSRIHLLQLRRDIASYEKEPLMAAIPSITLQNMWETISYVEKVLILVSLCVLLVGMLSILIALYTSINERRREMAILRSLGARSWHIFLLWIYESTFLVLVGSLCGVAILYGLLLSFAPYLERNFSVYFSLDPLSHSEWTYIICVIISGILAGIIPAIKAYKNSLQDGLTIRF